VVLAVIIISSNASTIVVTLKIKEKIAKILDVRFQEQPVVQVLLM
jgi:hypothetical protein